MSEIEQDLPERVEASADMNEAEEYHAELALENAIEAGYLTAEDAEEYLGATPPEIIIGVACYIEMAGHDAETILREWGVVSDEI